MNLQAKLGDAAESGPSESRNCLDRILSEVRKYVGESVPAQSHQHPSRGGGRATNQRHEPVLTWEISKALYTQLLGYQPGPEHQNEIAAIRHKVHEQIADAADGMVFVKTHHALVMDRGCSTLNFAATSGAIYIVRNPLDVAISYAHHIELPDRLCHRADGDGERGDGSHRANGLRSLWLMEPTRIELDTQAASGDPCHAV